MKIRRTALKGLKALRRNPMRAILTILGIVIGVGAVILMMEIGSGSSSTLQKTIASMGANVLMVHPGAISTGGASLGSGSEATLTPDDCEAIARQCPSVRAAAPMVRGRTQLVYGNRNWRPNTFYGTSPAFLKIRDWTNMADGEPFTERDVLNTNRVCVIGQTVVKELFQGESAVGKTIRVNSVPLRIVGVLSAKGANMMGFDQDDILIAPWTTIRYRVWGSTSQTATSGSSGSSSSSVNTLSNFYPGDASGRYPEQSTVQAANHPMLVRFASIEQITLSAASSGQISSAIREVKAVLRDRHRIGDGETDDFTIRDMTEMTNTLTSTTRLMTNLLLSVALISLVVGGVGIMNIMLVSVTERTREIGLRMAVGAKERDVLQQFLVEAVVLCLIGGAVGIVMGHGGSYLIELLLRWPVQTSPAAIALSVLVSASIGILFGFYPAWKASRLDPIEALRYE